MLKKFDEDKLKSFVSQGKEKIDEAKRVQSAYWRWEKTNELPIIAFGKLGLEQDEIPSPNLKEAFYDSEMMSYSQIRPFISVLNSGSRAVPSVRANMGVGVLLSLFGGGQLVFEDKMPWPREHFSKEFLSKFSVSDIEVRGDFELGLKHMRFFKELFGDSVPVYCMDHQGPFDLAHLLLGDQIFTEMYDDPQFVHHLLQVCVDVSIKAIEIMKGVSKEPEDICFHSNMIYGENMGIRICEDTSALLGPEQIAEFVIPYTAKLARRFGGAWVHYCGRNDGLTEQICALPEVKGINFGVIPGREYEHDFDKDMERCLNSKTIYVGNWHPYPEESIEDYLKRMHRWSMEGCLIPVLPNDKSRYGMDDQEMIDIFQDLSFT